MYPDGAKAQGLPPGKLSRSEWVSIALELTRGDKDVLAGEIVPMSC